MNWQSLYPNPHPPGCFWHKYAEMAGSPNIKWCEETLCQIVSEPANTWSNLLYMIVALLIWKDAKLSKSNSLRSFPPIIFIMGLMSLIYHLSNLYMTQVLDFIGMFLFVGWCLGINLIRLKKISEKKFIPLLSLWTVIMTVSLHILYLMTIKFQAIILLAGVVILITELLSQSKNRHWFWSSIGLLIIAFSFSVADHKRVFCDPHDHLIQGHALWHCIAALAMGTIWLHYRQFKNSFDLS